MIDLNTDKPFFYIVINEHVPSEPPEYGVVQWGQVGYKTVPAMTQGLADTLNKSLGHDHRALETAKICSMFDTWDNFIELAQGRRDMDHGVEGAGDRALTSIIKIIPEIKDVLGLDEEDES